MADMTELKNAIRIGTVQSVSAEKMTARVKFKDKGGITSGDLHIIKRPVYVIPAMESGTEGQTESAWVPDVNDMVLCIMLPDGDGDGFIVGEV